MTTYKLLGYVNIFVPVNATEHKIRSESDCQKNEYNCKNKIHRAIVGRQLILK